ncbi:MAG: nuclear transport factor 2 family protein [Pseudomonadota bacterium]
MGMEKSRLGTLRALAERWAARDIEGILACFAPGAEYFASVGPVPGTRAKGHDEITDLVVRMLQHDASTVTEVNDISIVGERAYWTWQYTDEKGAITLGCDFFVFDGSLIALKDAYRKVHDALGNDGENQEEKT